MLEDMSNSIVASEVPNVESDLINEERQTDQQIPKEFRRSGRIIRQPDRFMSGGEALEAEAIGHEDDPYTYNEAMRDVDNLWKNAMNIEMEWIGSNKVWELVDLPEGIKPIGCKWVDKRKRGVDGKVKNSR